MLRSVARIKCCDGRLDFSFKPFGKFLQVAFSRRSRVKSRVRLGEADRQCGGSRLQCQSSDSESPREKIDTFSQGRRIRGPTDMLPNEIKCLAGVPHPRQVDRVVAN